MSIQKKLTDFSKLIEALSDLAEAQVNPARDTLTLRVPAWAFVAYMEAWSTAAPQGAVNDVRGHDRGHYLVNVYVLDTSDEDNTYDLDVGDTTSRFSLDDIDQDDGLQFVTLPDDSE